MSFPNFVLLVITDHSGSGSGLPPSLCELPCPRWHHLQLPAFILFISALHQAEIHPRLVRAAEQQVTGSLAGRQGEKAPGAGAPAGAAQDAGSGGRRQRGCHRMAAEPQESGCGREPATDRGCSLGWGSGVGFGLFICFTYGSHEWQGACEFCTSVNSLSYEPPI